MSVSIRPARPEEARTLAALFLIAAGGAGEYFWGKEAASRESVLDVGERFFAGDGPYFSWRDCQVAEVEGRILGMVHSFFVPEDFRPEDEEIVDDPVMRPFVELILPGSHYVSALAVAEGARDAGIGSRLLEAVNEQARAAGEKRLSVDHFERNEGAGRLYRRLGFEEIDRRPVVPAPCFHYQDGDLVLRARDVW